MIPTYEEIMLPFLRHLSDGQEHSLSETHDKLADHFNLTDEEVRGLGSRVTETCSLPSLHFGQVRIEKCMPGILEGKGLHDR